MIEVGGAGVGIKNAIVDAVTYLQFYGVKVDCYVSGDLFKGYNISIKGDKKVLNDIVPWLEGIIKVN